MTGGAPERAINWVAFDTDDPYADVDPADLPDWWQENLHEFADYESPTYLPSLFVDGTVVQCEINRLEVAFNVDIQLLGVDVDHGDDWEIRVDSETVATLGKRRTGRGYSVFDLTSDVFESVIRVACRE